MYHGIKTEARAATSVTESLSPTPSASPDVSQASPGNTLVLVTGIFTALAGLAVILRIYVRAFMIKTLGKDDYLIAFAMMCSAGSYGLTVAMVNLGSGSHITNPILLANITAILRLGFIQSIVLPVGISAAKISVACFLLRLVQGKWYKRILYGWIIFLIVFTLASLGTIIFRCVPLAAAWDTKLAQLPTTKCYSNQVYTNLGLFNGAVNIFTDLAFAIMPIPLIIPLQVSIGSKLVLIGILSLGYFACIASIIKEILLTSFFANPDPFFDTSFGTWNDLEINLGILAASLPVLRPLCNRIFEIVRRTSSPVNFAHHRGYVRHEDRRIKLTSMPSCAETQASFSGKDEYVVSVKAGALKGATSPYKVNGLHWSNSSNAGKGPRNKSEKMIEEDYAPREDLSGTEVGVALGGNGQRIEYPWRSAGGFKSGGIMLTTEVTVTR